MEDKLKMICEISINKAVEISAELSKMEPGTSSFAQACDDLKDLVKTARMTKEMMHEHHDPAIAAK